MGVLNIIWEVWKTKKEREKEKVRQIEREREGRRRWSSSNQNQSTAWLEVENVEIVLVEGENEKETHFFFRNGMNLPAKIRYKSPIQPKWPSKASIFFGTKLPCFCTDIGTGTINSGHTGWYGTELTSLIYICKTPFWKLESRPLSLTPHKYLYLWSNYRTKSGWWKIKKRT